MPKPSLVDKRKRALLPAVKERQSLADALARYLAQLGPKRRHHVKRLEEVFNDLDKPEAVQ